MSGNTKFMGFGIDGMVTLARWGDEANVELSDESIEALRQACFQGLPKKPPTQAHSAKTAVNYDEETGAVFVRLTPEEALKLGTSLQLVDNSLAADLKGAYEDHIAYHDTSKEPGVDDQGSN